MKRTPRLLFTISIALLLVSCSAGQSAAEATQPAPTSNVQPPTLAATEAVATPTGQSATTAPTQAPSSSEVQVPIQGFAYHPADLTIAVGTTVTWTNKDGAPHTSTSDDGLWDSGALAQGDTYSHTFDQAGTFKYHCAIHTSIKGTITVTQ